MNNEQKPTEQKPVATEQKPETPPTQPTTPAIPEGLTPEQAAVFKQLSDTVAQAQRAAAAANAKASEPWYWNDFAKGIYVGAGVVLLACGGVYLYKKYTAESAE